MVEQPQPEARGPAIRDEDRPLWEALRRLVTVATQARPASARRMQVGPTDLDLLEQLAQGPLSPGDISRRLGITPPAATVAIQRLAERGHVAREADPADGRRALVRIRDTAHAELHHELAPMFEDVGEVIETLTPQEVSVVTGFLERIADALQSHADRPT